LPIACMRTVLRVIFADFAEHFLPQSVRELCKVVLF
jgi:hypothetical protein